MEVLQFIHSYWAYLVLVVLVLATINALIKFFGDKEFDAKDFRISLFALITMHIQLLIGIIFVRSMIVHGLLSFRYHHGLAHR